MSENKEISKIKIENQVYEIKDDYVREKLRELLGDPKESEKNTHDSK